VSSKKCLYPGCKKQPGFGFSGETSSFCAGHRLDGMIDVVTKKCSTNQCGKKATCGFPGGSPTKCAEHRMEGQEDISKKRCEHDGCRKSPSFGYIGKSRTHCKDHHLSGQVNVAKRMCVSEGCTTEPSFGFSGNKASHCKAHKLDGQTNVKCASCIADGCKTLPVFGYVGGGPTRCKPHCLEGMINVKRPVCTTEGCEVQSCFGFPGEQASRCKTHMLTGHVNLNKMKACYQDGCEITASYGLFGEIKSSCSAHQKEGYVRFGKRCVTEACSVYEEKDRPYATKINPVTQIFELCRDCSYKMFPGASKRVQVRQEYLILSEVQETFPEMSDYFLVGDKRLPHQTCSTYRPDMAWAVGDTLLHIEIDETETHEDNVERLVSIHAASDLKYHSVIRFNAGDVTDSGGEVLFDACLTRFIDTDGEPRYKRAADWNRRMNILMACVEEVFRACVEGNGCNVAGKRRLCFRAEF